MDPGQDGQNIDSDLDPNHLTLRKCSEKNFLKKLILKTKTADGNKSMKNYQECNELPGLVVQLVMCLTADPGAASLFSTLSHTFMKIDHEIISTAILLPSTDSRGVVASCKGKYALEVLVNRLVKLTQEKSVVR